MLIEECKVSIRSLAILKLFDLTLSTINCIQGSTNNLIRFEILTTGEANSTINK